SPIQGSRKRELQQPTVGPVRARGVPAAANRETHRGHGGWGCNHAASAFGSLPRGDLKHGEWSAWNDSRIRGPGEGRPTRDEWQMAELYRRMLPLSRS